MKEAGSAPSRSRGVQVEKVSRSVLDFSHSAAAGGSGGGVSTARALNNLGLCHLDEVSSWLDDLICGEDSDQCVLANVEFASVLGRADLHFPVCHKIVVLLSHNDLRANLTADSLYKSLLESAFLGSPGKGLQAYVGRTLPPAAAAALYYYYCYSLLLPTTTH